MTIVLTLLAIFFFLLSAYQMWYAISGLYYESPQRPLESRQNRFLVMVYGPQSDDYILTTAQAATVQYYPKSAYDVVVIADNLQQSTIEALKELPIILFQGNFGIDKKAASLYAALKACSTEYNAVVVLDSDNFMKPDFLQRINDRINEGYRVIQGQHTLKNKEHFFGMLTGFFQKTKAHIFSKGHNYWGLSANLTGAGMALDYQLFTEAIRDIDTQGAFHQSLELQITALGEHIQFDDKAIIYLENQIVKLSFPKFGSSWFSYQLNFLSKFAKNAWRILIYEKNYDYFIKLLQNLFVPRHTLILLLFLGSIFSPVAQALWIIGLCLHLSSYLFAVPFFEKKIVDSSTNQSYPLSS